MLNITNKVYVGIDVHHLKHRVAIISDMCLHQSKVDWKKATIFDIKNNYSDFQLLDSAIKEHVLDASNAAIAVDQTGGHYSEPLVWFLQNKGYDVCHLEPKAVKAARERLLDEECKSDTIDAAGAAYLLYLRDVHGISFRISAVAPVLGSQASVLQCLILQRIQYNKLIVQCTNRLHQLLIATFPEGEVKYFRQLLRVINQYPTPQDIIANPNLDGVMYMARKDKEAIATLAKQTVGVPGTFYRELIKDLCRQRNDCITKRDTITRLMKEKVGSHPYGNILLSFPCLGVVAAATIIALVKDISRWPDKKKLKKAFGIYSTSKQSGVSTSRGKLGKEGSRHTRKALFYVVLGCIQGNTCENDFKDLYLRQLMREKPKLKAIVSTMGKLTEIIYHCLKNGEKYQYQRVYG